MNKTVTLSDLLLKEFKHEVNTSRRVLECIPEDKLSWAPHEKSMTMGQLGYHIAVIPGVLTELFTEQMLELPDVTFPQPQSLSEILSALDQGETASIERLSSWDDDDLQAVCQLTQKGEPFFTESRYFMLRSVMLNHWFHHRGQLVVYLRLLDIPVPAVYGPSADEDPSL
ncbi:DinB family protein [Caldalkalibacillus salinus]|uniref:DinB family protein n=1 Tax=Caldalkalibacillus salinus TaxID=2803787 RepID=UPI001920D845|nr:DinB family protein [Caldalkalibacillus salinus]